jgi:hypothetical protein
MTRLTMCRRDRTESDYSTKVFEMAKMQILARQDSIEKKLIKNK